MSTYRVTFDIALKDDSIESNDFIYAIIEQSLEGITYLNNAAI